MFPVVMGVQECVGRMEAAECKSAATTIPKGKFRAGGKQKVQSRSRKDSCQFLKRMQPRGHKNLVPTPESEHLAFLKMLD